VITTRCGLAEGFLYVQITPRYDLVAAKYRHKFVSQKAPRCFMTPQMHRERAAWLRRRPRIPALKLPAGMIE
jgi:hypothetical protein